MNLVLSSSPFPASRNVVPANQTSVYSLQDGPEDDRHNTADEDDDDDDDSVSIDIIADDTDEEYRPQDLTVTSSKNAKRKNNTPDKENGQNESPEKTKDLVQCLTCHKTFQSKYYLKVHNRRHTGEKPFKCSKCGKCYYRKDNLLEHESRNCLRSTNVSFLY